MALLAIQFLYSPLVYLSIYVNKFWMCVCTVNEHQRSQPIEQTEERCVFRQIMIAQTYIATPILSSTHTHTHTRFRFFSSFPYQHAWTNTNCIAIAEILLEIRICDRSHISTKKVVAFNLSNSNEITDTIRHY